MLEIVPVPSVDLLNRFHSPNDAPTFTLGGDLARFGGDNNLAFLRHGDWVFCAYRWAGLDTVENASVFAEIIEKWERYGWYCQWACLDVIGVGAGVVDNLWHRSQRYEELVKGINVAYASSNKRRFRNVRSEIAWNLRSRFRDRRVKFLTEKLASGLSSGFHGIPDGVIQNLRMQATSIKYKSDEHESGVVVVESKKDYKSRMEKSPDEFDGLALTFNDDFLGLERRPRRKSGEFAGFVGR